MKTRFRILEVVLILCTSALPISIHAQNNDPAPLHEKDNDVQFRTGFELEKKVVKWFSISWSEELRLQNNLTQLDRIYSDISFSFKATDWLKFAAAYTFISAYHEGKKKTNYENYWDFRHRASASVTFVYKTYSNWEFSLREKAQATFLNKKDYDKLEKCSPAWALKSRVMAKYKVRPVPLIPYVYVELCNTLKTPELIKGNYLEKVRSAVGLEYRFNKRNSIDFFYRFDYNFDKKLKVKKSGVLKSITHKKEFNNVFNISYKYKF